MYKVRFNLMKGKYEHFWKITNLETKEKQYVNPKEFNLIINGCFLYNNKAMAIRIHAGLQAKNSCSWVVCDSVEVIEPTTASHAADDLLKYNPRVEPYWRDHLENDIDKLELSQIISDGFALFRADGAINKVA